MHIYFPGGAKVFADHHGFTIQTDQPVSADDRGSAPTPFDLFLASIGTCAGIYVLGFCQQRGIPTDGISLDMNTQYDRTTGMVTNVAIDIHVPADFPEQYKPSLIKVADLCKVKKHLADPPEFAVKVV
ncbi:osmotically inducible protein OsmC [Candidatus Wirthbacteria bacterium CG2_30_54_11]|uniref:Osmotically inducible protein OsmC n=1 Tax=Candidatus Wirthbacteria bacterium CG2_30_54_11 TaxID=1817892 RepID=A0A1J5IK94_9BACT|nr:MAG: osmotically inducible protein OsmC [Candidatus Wirthbacteria bacterium CG2_30_54_11]